MRSVPIRATKRPTTAPCCCGPRWPTRQAHSEPACAACRSPPRAFWPPTSTILEDLSGRAFADPGFLAWNLADYARAVGDRGLLASARGFVERAFGMKSLPPFSSEPSAPDGLFDFSSSTATRVLAILACEGSTPFMSAWLRERVAPALPDGFVPRSMDENCWNACVAAALGQGYMIATDPVFLRAHQAIMNRLDAQVGTMSGTLGRQPGFDDETVATFYYATALDSLLKS